MNFPRSVSNPAKLHGMAPKALGILKAALAERRKVLAG